MTKPYHRKTANAASGAALVGLALLAPPCGAQGESEGLPLWELGIGAAAYHQPSYPGSDVRSTTGFPFPYVIYRGEFFRIDRSLQGILYETQRVKVDFSAGATSIVDSDESDARVGMPDLDPTFDIGPALSLLLTNPARSDSIWGRVAVRSAVSVGATIGWMFWQSERRVAPKNTSPGNEFDTPLFGL
jgi:outer membrane scaffolding protein for murein synthesis (MipA/OmpV family)